MEMDEILVVNMLLLGKEGYVVSISMTRIFVNLIRFDHSFWGNVRQYKLLSCPLIEYFAQCLPHSPNISNHLVLLIAQRIYILPNHTKL